MQSTSNSFSDTTQNKLNILFIAYSCMPDSGSEDKIGWNIPLECAKHNKVVVVTKEEHKKGIEEYLAQNDIPNIEFHFVDINKIYKKLFKGPTYSIRLNIWHKKAFPIVKKICEEKNIDIIHQITPIEFRSIGKYYEIKNTKFVCGPLGGGEVLPDAFKPYIKGNKLVEVSRSILNRWFRFKHRFFHTFKKCDHVFFANKETQEYLSDLVSEAPFSLFTEIGIGENDITIPTPKNHSKFTMMVAGRLTYRKGHSFLLDTLKLLPKDLDYECKFIGDGPMEKKLKDKVRMLGLEDKVTFVGSIPFDKMAHEYENADVFIMPSLRETTGSVLLEAMSKGLPVVTINHFGGPMLLDSSVSYLYDGDSLERYKSNLRDILIQCAKNPHELHLMSEQLTHRAKNHLWSKKVEYYNSIYKQVMNK
ncbi:MAG: glycosyltransferase [Ruminococcus sp.]|nr:glycosyltransferase [Ruminococcus sp.]